MTPRPTIRVRRSFIFSAMLVLSFSAGSAQTSPSQVNTPHLPVMQSGNGGLGEGAQSDPDKLRQQAIAERSQNEARHRKLVADTDRLFALAEELKAEVGRSTKNEMSVEVIRKAAEIEKLAHDVKERMKS